MFETLECIALRAVKYNDRNSILSVFTRQHGRVSLLLSWGKSREAMRMRAICMPLGKFECVVDMRPGRDIYNMRDVRPCVGNMSVTFSPVKSAIALFVADFLSSLLREPQQDELLYAFLEQSIAVLANAEGQSLANFHICFMLRLQHFLGIEPDWATYSNGAVFDLADGIFRAVAPLHSQFIPSQEAEVVFLLRRMNFRTMSRFGMTRAQRNRILDCLLEYYQIHFPTLGSLNSLGVMRTMFDF